MIEYTSKYFNVIAPVVRQFLRKRYGRELSKRAYEGARPIYRQMLADCPPIGSDNPMAKNLYEACVFFSMYRAADGDVSPDMMRTVVRDIFSMRIMSLPGLFMNINRHKDMVSFNAKMRSHAQWAEEHPETKPYTWDFNFGDTRGDTQACFHYTHCPFNDFCQEQGLMDILPVMCEIDNITPRLIHGTLVREHTLATGGPVCDYLIRGDGEGSR